ncbi:dTMP kinase [Haloimpatiens sp. FM7330]|uniref:dTMP kinase n=1 Tax=Haloimpatiens sp. FM7330 TaxID=3298610 RepID=UPI0036410739
MKKGLLITLEGPDGSGKTTQIQLLEEYLKQKGFEIIKTREPGGTPISEKIRNIILDNRNTEMSDMCEALLYAASRAQLVNEIIKPSIEEGKIVICDRFVLSSIVYQGIGRELGIEKIKYINQAALEGLEPDLTIMLTIPYEEGLKRKYKQKTLDRLENSGNKFHEKVFNGYLDISKNYDKIKLVNANKNVKEVHNQIVEIVDSLIKNK